jgi:hypothetical protein
MYAFLTYPGYGIDVAAVRARYPEVGWTRFADWAATVVEHWDSIDTGTGATA